MSASLVPAKSTAWCLTSGPVACGSLYDGFAIYSDGAIQPKTFQPDHDLKGPKKMKQSQAMWMWVKTLYLSENQKNLETRVQLSGNQPQKVPG